MGITRLKHGILRLINYKAGANQARFRKAVDYITNSKKTNSKFTIFNYLNRDNPMGSLEALEVRYQNEKLDGRLFKHGIISFGAPELSVAAAKEVVEETLGFYQDYPYLAALHTDVPHRLHAHFLLLMRNVRTGKKFSQSISELAEFRRHYHSVAVKHKLLGLKDCDDTRENNVLQGGHYDGTDSLTIPTIPSGMEYMSFSPVCNTNNVMWDTAIEDSSSSDLVNEIFKQAQDDFYDFFELGFMIGGAYNDK